MSTYKTYSGDLNAAYNSYDLQLQVDTNNPPSIRQLARGFDVNHVSLSKRIKGSSVDRKHAYTHLQALSPSEEAA
jgi:hypothetical protein